MISHFIRSKPTMSFWKALFGGAEETPEEEQTSNEAKRFDLMKYDGVKAMKSGQFDYALRCFEEALKMKDDLETHDYLSRTYVRLDRLDDALKELDVMARAEPTNTDVLLTMAHVAYMNEDYVLMTDACERCIAIESEQPTAYYLYAQAALGQGDMVNCIARLSKAIAIDGNHADARLLRSQTLLKMGDVKGAEEDAQWLAEHVGDQEDVLMLAAHIAHAQGNDDQAILIYNKVTELNPFHVEAYAERGKLYYDHNDKRHAEEDMKKVLELNPQQMADVSGDYSAEGVEQQMKRAYSMMNPFGI